LIKDGEFKQAIRSYFMVAQKDIYAEAQALTRDITQDLREFKAASQAREE
jgi:hypothetical protein